MVTPLLLGYADLVKISKKLQAGNKPNWSFLYPSNLRLMISEKVVTPVKTGVQGAFNLLKLLDSGFRRNDEKLYFQSFYEIIKVVKNKKCFLA